MKGKTNAELVDEFFPWLGEAERVRLVATADEMDGQPRPSHARVYEIAGIWADIVGRLGATLFAETKLNYGLA